jgi:hypothetical protein
VVKVVVASEYGKVWFAAIIDVTGLAQWTLVEFGPGTFR